MTRMLALLLFLIVVAVSWAEDTTEITFVAPTQEPVFRVTSVLVEPSGLSLSSDVTEVLKRMELLTLAPSTVRLPHGDYHLNWGGTEDFNRSFYLKADGSPREVHLLGSRPGALWSLIAAGSGGLAAAIMGPLAVRDAAFVPWALGATSVSVAGLVGLLLFSPRVEVR